MTLAWVSSVKELGLAIKENPVALVAALAIFAVIALYVQNTRIQSVHWKQMAAEKDKHLELSIRVTMIAEKLGILAPDLMWLAEDTRRKRRGRLKDESGAPRPG